MTVSEVTAQQVAALRKESGAGMMDAKRALQESGGDVEHAKQLLREKGLASAKRRTGRVTEQGSIGSYLHYQADRPVIGVIVELASETDFVAKSSEFQTAANDIAMHVAAARPRWIRREDVPEDVLAEQRDLIAAQARNEGKPDAVIERIIEGRITAFYEDTVLYDQKFINPEKFEGSVGDMVEAMAAQMGENIGVSRMARIGVGEAE
jgi:elongation factor Ts